MAEAPEGPSHVTKRSPPRTAALYSGDTWRMYVDGASNNRGAGAGIVLVSPEGTLHEHSLSIGFPSTNNEAEYEALLAGLRLAIKLQIEELHVYSDSLLVVNQLNSDYGAGDNWMVKYLRLVSELQESFGRVHFWHVGRALNAHADALAALGSACSELEGSRSITLGDIPRPSFDPEPEPQQVTCTAPAAPSWVDPLIAYLRDEQLPPDRKAAHRIRCQAASYFLSAAGQLYRRTYMGPDLRVLRDEEVQQVLHELHGGSCGCHSGGRSLAERAVTQGY